MSIHWPIIRALASRPARVAVVDDQRSYSGAAVLVGALHVAEALSRVSQSPRVGLLLPAGGAFPIAALGAWMLGRTVVPLNFLLKKDELQFVVVDSGIDTILSASPMLTFMGDSAPRAKTVLRMDEMPMRSVPEARWPALCDPDDLGVLLYTSGTSGKPKGVMLTHGNISANVSQVVRHTSIDHRDVVLGVLPQFHTFGLTVLTVLPLTLSMKAVYTARFAVAKLLSLMREHRPTIFIGIPSMYNAMLHSKNAKAEDFASLRYVVSGGEPLPRAVLEGFRERFGVTINEGYGLTETSPVTNWCRPEEFQPGSVGPPLPDVDQRIIDMETGQALPPGRDGEIRMKGPNVMRGYFNRPAETSAAFDEQGFFRTGDIGRFDSRGHLFITGRLKEMLIVGGENVFPREIEEVLNTHPHIKDSGVVGKTDPMRGEVPIAFVELKDGVSTSASGEGVEVFDSKSVIKHCRERLAGYKVPDEVRVLEALPRNATGKVMRRELKQALGTRH